MEYFYDNKVNRFPKMLRSIKKYEIPKSELYMPDSCVRVPT